MKNLKQQFAELKENTPKHIQWLLLVAAFIVVVILLTLLFGEKKQTDLSNTNKTVPVLNIEPDIVNWSDVTVGQKKTQPIKITASAPVKIKDVRLHKEIAGFHITDTCKAIRQINDKVACVITAIYEPTKAANTEQLPIFIDWYDAAESETMTHSDKIVLSLGAVAPVVEKQSEPIVEQKSEPVVEDKKEPVVEQKSEPVVEIPDTTENLKEPEETKEKDIEQSEPIPVKQEIKKDIESIAPAINFDEDSYTPPPETCSDFAFPGYDNSGRQIGWIKPEGGTYKFHPFSDTECNNPTGIYNPNNGIITDINSKGKRIGTDAEHIGRAITIDGKLPELSNAPAIKSVNRARQLSNDELDLGAAIQIGTGAGHLTSEGIKPFSNTINPAPKQDVSYESTGQDTVVSSEIRDRQFLLRQYKPIPATIVSDVRADPEALANSHLPVRATVDRNVYSDNGRNVIIPTGTLMLGYVTGKLPGPYTSIGRMDIKWYQFILPNGVEFNFGENAPFSGDAQGRSGIPGYGSTDYLEQFFMPMLTAIVPATVNLIAPISDAFVNQIDLDNNTVVQSGTMRSSEMAKNEIISAWNSVAQKLLVDMMDNTVPPFTIAAGTRITVYSPVDLMVTCGAPADHPGKKCAVHAYGSQTRNTRYSDAEPNYNDGSWVGQSRSFNIGQFCVTKDGKQTADSKCKKPSECDGYDYRTVLMYCESLNYKTKTEVQMDAYKQSSQEKYQETYGGGYDSKTGKFQGNSTQQAAYDEMVGITYDEDGFVENPFGSPEPAAPEEPVMTCLDGSLPDANGCCAGEIYTDMGEAGFNCCPETGGDCFPPIK